jgi:centractin
VLDIGDGVTHCIPVYEGFGVTAGMMRQNLAGRDLTDYMAVLLREVCFVCLAQKIFTKK